MKWVLGTLAGALAVVGLLYLWSRRSAVAQTVAGTPIPLAGAVATAQKVLAAATAQAQSVASKATTWTQSKSFLGAKLF